MSGLQIIPQKDPNEYFLRKKRGYTIHLHIQKKLVFKLRGSDLYSPQCVLFQEYQEKIKLLGISLFGEHCSKYYQGKENTKLFASIYIFLKAFS